MLKKTLASFSAGFLLVALVSCVSGEGLDSETEDATVSIQEGAEASSSAGEPTSSPANAERRAFGGQCYLFAENVLRSVLAAPLLGAFNFDPNRTEGMEYLSTHGFGSYAEWITEVETIRGGFSGVDTSLL